MKTFHSDFRIEYIWDDPGGVSSPELAATWARVSIECGGSIATIIRNRKLGITRGDIYIPLYSLAEWFVKNWWFVFNECSSSEKASDRKFLARHNLAFSNEGICLPSISFSKNGDDTLVKWTTIDYSSANLQFLTNGCYLVDQNVFKTRVSQLICDTIQRLRDRSVFDTFLENEWKEISAIDLDEKVFCEIASRIGIDPFSVSEDFSDTIIHSYENMDLELRDEFFYASNSDSFEANLRWLNSANKQFDAKSSGMVFRSSDFFFSEEFSNKFPWEIGYDWAKRLRKQMGIESQTFDFKRHFDLNVGDGVYCQSYRDSNIEALLKRNQRNSFSIVLNKESFNVDEEGTRFLLARALCETLTTKVGRPGIVTRVDSKFQKITRAFAAELLAPADHLSKMVRCQTVGYKEIQEMKEQFLVSEFVITHQLINHGIAKIESSDPVLGLI